MCLFTTFNITKAAKSMENAVCVVLNVYKLNTRYSSFIWHTKSREIEIRLGKFQSSAVQATSCLFTSYALAWIRQHSILVHLCQNITPSILSYHYYSFGNLNQSGEICDLIMHKSCFTCLDSTSSFGELHLSSHTIDCNW